MAILTKDQILAASDRKTEVVAVPEWGGDVMLAEMDASARERYEALAMKAQGGAAGTTLRAELVALCAVHPDTRAPLFSGPAEVEQLAKKSAKVVDRLFKRAVNMNVLDAAAAEEQAGN